MEITADGTGKCGFRYADLMNDDVFKLVFGQESGTDVMKEFLNRVITDRNIVDLEFMDKEMRSVNRANKDSVYDMFCRTDDGSRIIVEVQRRKQDFYVDRTIYYSTFQIRNQIERGADEYELYPVYVVNILDFDMDENKGNPDVKTVFRLYEENSHALLTDKLTIIYLEIGKFKKTLEELDGDILEGIYFCLKNIHELDSRPAVFEHDVFKNIFYMSELVEMDEYTRSKVLQKMTTERDLRNQMAYAKRIAIAEGLEEASRRMLAAGMLPEKVSEILGIPVSGAKVLMEE